MWFTKEQMYKIYGGNVAAASYWYKKQEERRKLYEEVQAKSASK